MRLQEAYSILGLSPNASQDDAKKKYRELTKKYHPDVNKEDGAEDKFKKINEAYAVIQKGEDGPQFQGIDFGDFVNSRNSPFRKRRQPPEIINLNTTISFKESIFGCKRDFTYERRVKCDQCDGNGAYPLHNGCTECQGQGVVITRQGNMIIQQTCRKCHGKQNFEECKTCSSVGGIKSTRTVSVTIPPGISNGGVLRLEGMGNFVEVVNNFFNSGDAYTDAFVRVNVEKSEFECQIKDKNLHTPLKITLLEALRGCTKSVETLNGKKEIEIVKKTKNAQQVILPNLGVARIGNQIVDINVEYPQDIDSLIDYLSKSEN